MHNGDVMYYSDLEYMVNQDMMDLGFDVGNIDDINTYWEITLDDIYWETTLDD